MRYSTIFDEALARKTSWNSNYIHSTQDKVCYYWMKNELDDYHNTVRLLVTAIWRFSSSYKLS